MSIYNNYFYIKWRKFRYSISKIFRYNIKNVWNIESKKSYFEIYKNDEKDYLDNEKDEIFCYNPALNNNDENIIELVFYPNTEGNTSEINMCHTVFLNAEQLSDLIDFMKRFKTK